MSGMKEGTGDDPFAEEHDGDRGAERDVDAILEDTSSSSSEGRDRDSKTDDTVRTNSPPQRESSMDIPYIFRRDSVQDARERVPLFLMEDTKGMERSFKAELENEFNDTVKVTDVREAAYLVGMNHTSKVVDQLEEWGYGLDD